MVEDAREILNEDYKDYSFYILVSSMASILIFIGVWLWAIPLRNSIPYVFYAILVIAFVLTIGCCNGSSSNMDEVDVEAAADGSSFRLTPYGTMRQAVASLPIEADMRCPLCDETLTLAAKLRNVLGTKVKKIAFHCQAGDPPCPLKGPDVST